MKDRYIAQTVSTLGRRYTGFDTRTYLAVSTVQRVYIHNKKQKDIKKGGRQLYKGLVKEVADEINADKLKLFSRLNNENRNKVILEDMMSKYKERQSAQKQSQQKKTHRPNITFSQSASPLPHFHQRANLSVANIAMDDYLGRYGDIFKRTQVRRDSTKNPPQRMATIEHNKWATAMFMNVGASDCSKSPRRFGLSATSKRSASGAAW